VDEQVCEIAHQLQTKLETIDSRLDGETLIWMHGFLTGLVNRIQARIPEIKTRRRKELSSKDALAELKRLTDDLESRSMRLSNDNPDSLERIERELGGPGTTPVPARRKPGPKGLTGGVALPLPVSDLTM
jgi:hypothetical protein